MRIIAYEYIPDHDGRFCVRDVERRHVSRLGSRVQPFQLWIDCQNIRVMRDRPRTNDALRFKTDNEENIVAVAGDVTDCSTRSDRQPMRVVATRQGELRHKRKPFGIDHS